MKIDPSIIRALNEVLSIKLIAINQYFLHARMLKNWGLDELGKDIYHHSIEDMKDADKIIKRIFMLEGLPNLQDLGKLLIGETPEEIIQCDINVEDRLHETLIRAIRECEAQKDYVSRELLVEFKDDHETRSDWLSEQLDLMKEMGVENYLQSACED